MCLSLNPQQSCCLGPILKLGFHRDAQPHLLGSRRQGERLGRPAVTAVVPPAHATPARSVIVAWLLSGHWILNNVIGVALVVSIVSVIKLPSLKVSNRLCICAAPDRAARQVAALCLLALFVYDIFWVFCSSYFFGDNVMVKVATTATSNPAARGQRVSVGRCCGQRSRPRPRSV